MGANLSDASVPARRLFAANIRRREERIDLALAALLIAAEEYPRLVIEDYLERLDQLGSGLAVELDPDSAPEVKAATVSSHLGRDQGFGGDREDYFDPRNSYLNEVLDRRVGLPIALSIVYLEVAQRAGVHLLPVAMPGHFLVKMPGPAGDVVIDPFDSGRLLDLDGCKQLFQSLFGPGAELRESMLGAATKRQVIQRVLQNLKRVYLDRNDVPRALRVVELITLVSPWDLDQVRDRGLLRFRLGRMEDALTDLRAFAQHAPPGPSVDSIRKALRKIGPQ